VLRERHHALPTTSPPCPRLAVHPNSATVLPTSVQHDQSGTGKPATSGPAVALSGYEPAVSGESRLGKR
jgi:hypothetical protein